MKNCCFPSWGGIFELNYIFSMVLFIAYIIHHERRITDYSSWIQALFNHFKMNNTAISRIKSVDKFNVRSAQLFASTVSTDNYY